VSVLTVEGLWKGYERSAVLRGVDLEVPAGSLTAVLGLSGCGKTTLLRVIAGFERPQRGSVRLGGRMLEGDGAYVAPEQRGIGYVPQEGALFPHLTVAGNVGFGLPRRERRSIAVKELLDMVGIGALSERMPHELSGGEQQRVALARALARRPQALLLDEPFSSLDASLRTHLREEVHALLRAQQVTTVLVTHDQEEALSLADKVAVLRDGRIVQQGSPVDLYEQPVDERLASFLGAVNLLPADFRDGRAETALGRLPLRASSELAGSGVVMVRPEQLEVLAAERAGGDGGDGGDGIVGTVSECRYYGHDAVLRIEPAVEARGTERLLARVQGEHALAVGTSVRVRAHGAVSVLEGEPLAQPEAVVATPRPGDGQRG
jgi:iron(III) transport system ATP-binding protein